MECRVANERDAVGNGNGRESSIRKGLLSNGSEIVSPDNLVEILTGTKGVFSNGSEAVPHGDTPEVFARIEHQRSKGIQTVGKSDAVQTSAFGKGGVPEGNQATAEGGTDELPAIGKGLFFDGVNAVRDGEDGEMKIGTKCLKLDQGYPLGNMVGSSRLPSWIVDEGGHRPVEENSITRLKGLISRSDANLGKLRAVVESSLSD